MFKTLDGHMIFTHTRRESTCGMHSTCTSVRFLLRSEKF